MYFIILIDELGWMYHLVSTNHLQLFLNDENKIAKKFFQMIFSPYSDKLK